MDFDHPISVAVDYQNYWWDLKQVVTADVAAMLPIPTSYYWWIKRFKKMKFSVMLNSQ